MDYKGFIIYLGAVAVEDLNAILSNGVLVLNIIYIGYQIYTHHKKNNGD